MSTASTLYATEPSHGLIVQDAGIDVPLCERGIGTVVTGLRSDRLIDGVRIEPVAVWPDDRGHFMEVVRVGQSLVADYPPTTTQISATLTYPGIIKAFHYHLKQYDCWTVVSGMMQVALADFRKDSRTFGQRNTLYIGSMRPWQVLIPPGVAHGYKVISQDASMLVYATSRFYDTTDELRIPYDDTRLNYAWETQFK